MGMMGSGMQNQLFTDKKQPTSEKLPARTEISWPPLSMIHSGFIREVETRPLKEGIQYPDEGTGKTFDGSVRRAVAGSCPREMTGSTQH
jgi:hypothetical protein